jgi:hypothetical protein
VVRALKTIDFSDSVVGRNLIKVLANWFCQDLRMLSSNVFYVRSISQNIAHITVHFRVVLDFGNTIWDCKGRAVTRALGKVKYLFGVELIPRLR